MTLVKTPFLILCLFLLILPFSSYSLLAKNTPFGDSTQLTIDQHSLFQEWQKQDVLPLKLEADFTQLIANKNTGTYQSASLTVYHKTDKKYTSAVQIKARGKFRRRICDFPPLKIKLKEKNLEGIELGNYKTFKLVTHCHNKQITRPYLLKEYLAYQLYQQLTPHSYQIQLVEITYTDLGEELPKMKRYGILIEDKDELEDRMNADDCDCGFETIVPQSQDAAAKLALFQLMIGNTDWNFLAHRNIKVLQSRTDQHPIPVPYDFDFSGFVNAPYAIPNPTYQLKSVLDRVMIGNDWNPESMSKAIRHFINQKEQLFLTIKKQKGLSFEDKQFLKSYLKGFYQLIETDFVWKENKVIPFELK